MIYKVAIDNDVSTAEPTYIPIHDPDLVSTGCIAYNKSYTKELNKAGSFKFTVAPNHPNYDYIYKLRSTVYVTSDTELLWIGRVVSIHKDLYGVKNVTCEGALAFLNDILIKPFYYPITQSQTTPGVSIGQHISQILSLYNARCSPKRRLTITANLPSAFSTKDSYAIAGVESYTTALDELTNCLQYESTLRMCIEYSTTYDLAIKMVPFGTCDNSIVLTKNLIDTNTDEDGTEIYTSIIPIDDDNRSFNFGNGVYYVDNGYKDTYGVIERSLSIGAVSDLAVSFIQNACAEVLSKEFRTLNYPKVTLTAIDLYNLGFVVDPDMTPSDAIDIGYKVHIVIPHLGIEGDYTCTTLTNNLEEPDASTFTFEYFPDVEPEPTRTRSRSNTQTPTANIGDQRIQNGSLTRQVTETFKRLRKDQLTVRRHPDKVIYTDSDQSYVPPDVVSGETFDTYTEVWFDELDSTTEVKRQVYGVGVTGKGTANEQVTRLVYPNKTFIRLEGF